MLKRSAQVMVQLMGLDLESFGYLMFIVKATRLTLLTAVSPAGVPITATTTLMWKSFVKVSESTHPPAFKHDSYANELLLVILI